MEDDFVSGLEPKRDGTKNCRNLKRTHIIWSGLVAERQKVLARQTKLAKNCLFCESEMEKGELRRAYLTRHDFKGFFGFSLFHFAFDHSFLYLSWHVQTVNHIWRLLKDLVPIQLWTLQIYWARMFCHFKKGTNLASSR